MPTSIVNLDGLIQRDDFRVKSQNAPDYSRRDKIAITDIEPKAFMYLALRKPDFQRETANWSPQKIQDFVKTFLEGDLIPAVILWAAGETVFVIDGSHRLSALIAWVQDDYGDGDMSRKFSKNDIPKEQIRAAQKTRELIDETIGSYADHVLASQHPDRAKADVLHRAKMLGSLSLDLQWIRNTDSEKAENSFFKINQAATPIDPTELRIIRARKAGNAIASRVINRNSTGHEYWAEFGDRKQEIETIGRELYLRLKNLYLRVFEELKRKKTAEQILEALRTDKEFSFLTPDERFPEGGKSQFSKETKSATFLRDAIGGAPRCKICKCLLHYNSIQVDHIVRKQDGGLGILDNAQLAHPFCNSTYKN